MVIFVILKKEWNWFLIVIGNGVIDFDEFTDMLDKTKCIADPEADLKEAFRVFDLDGDGIITVNI